MWEIRALFELGTVEMFDSAGSTALIEARELAVSAGALMTAMYVDLHLAICHFVRAEPELCLAIAQRCERQARRFGLPVVHGLAVAVQAQAHAHRGDRAAMEEAIGRALAIGGQGDPRIGDPVIDDSVGIARGDLALIQGDPVRALREFDAAMAHWRGCAPPRRPRLPEGSGRCCAPSRTPTVRPPLPRCGPRGRWWPATTGG